MHQITRAALVAFITIVALVPTSTLANASTADVRVRIEGVHQTVIDRVVRADSSAVRAASDATARRCDGTNAGRHPAPGPTSTGAAASALARHGLDFDGRWDAGIDDYFITRLGAERENLVYAHQWGIIHNGVMQGVGGCQQRVATGDEVLFANDAHSNRPLLWLTLPAVTVSVGAPLTVQVHQAAAGSAPADRTAAAGVTLHAVDAIGHPVAAQPVTTHTDAAGNATVQFATPGWHRLKARAPGSGTVPPPAIASAAVAVCVTAPDVPTCAGVAPGEDPLAVGFVPQVTPDPPAGPAPGVMLTAIKLGNQDARRGRLRLSWGTQPTSSAVQRWTVESRIAGRDGRWQRRASGDGGSTHAVLRLPAGRRHELRLVVADTAGNVATVDAGTALSPIDDRSRKLKRKGSWRIVRDRAAWQGKYRTGRSGSQLKVRLQAGRPTLLVRGVRKSARVELRAGGKRQTIRIRGSRTKRTREIAMRRNVKAGWVTVTVRSGQVGIDGVAAG